jgi:hypothetical protein
MAFFLLLLAVFLVLFLPVVLLIILRRPIYRLTRENVIELFDLILSGKAKEQDWLVFVAVKINHDALLEKIRILCVELENTEFKGLGLNNHLLTARGEQQLRLYLSWLKS